jgi:hypothetical protein
MGIATRKWLRTRWKGLLMHSLILSGFLLFCIFLSRPLFDRLETIDDEAKLQNVLLPSETQNLRLDVDRPPITTRTIEVRGWAYIDGQSSENSQTYVVLKSDDSCYVFDTLPQLRTGVTSAYGYSTAGSLDLDWSGFDCNIPLSRIGTGEYALGIYIKKADIEALQSTVWVLVKSSSVVQWREVGEL